MAGVGNGRRAIPNAQAVAAYSTEALNRLIDALESGQAKIDLDRIENGAKAIAVEVKIRVDRKSLLPGEADYNFSFELASPKALAQFMDYEVAGYGLNRHKQFEIIDEMMLEMKGRIQKLRALSATLNEQYRQVNQILSSNSQDESWQARYSRPSRNPERQQLRTST